MASASLISSPGKRFPARATLRDATAAAHDRVDAAFGGFDLGDVADYRRFLAAQAAAFLPVETALDRGDAARVIPGWPGRRRAALLRADLAALDLAPRELPRPAFDTPEALCGAAYVLEGSRLGGAMLVRRVAPGLPTAFLAAPGEPGAWRTLLDRLDAVLADEPARLLATAAARCVFDLFLQAAKDPHG